MAKRVLLLCFIHGFKGSDDTFQAFPDDLKRIVSANLGAHQVESAVYPRYETMGELAQSVDAFLEWLKAQVMSLRKAVLETPWPANDRHVGVVLVAHSMGGFVVADALFKILDERHANGDPPGPTFPLIQGILAFDTPYNGLARSLFVYGAFSNYHKVSSVFNVMTALSAAAPAALGRLTLKRAAGASAARSAAKTLASSRSAWKVWSLVAMRTGTVGAIAAGGVTAYMHRQQIMEGVRTVRSLNKQSVIQGYQQSVDAVGQGLAYINRGNVGQSFAWLSDHFTFIGALMKQSELNRRLERLAALRGIGVADLYASLGETGYWSGGYFVPERTFCAVPAKNQSAASMFSRHVVEDVEDEIDAHLSLFKPDKNKSYERMTDNAAKLVVQWFDDETETFDDPKYALASKEPLEEEVVAKAVEDAQALDDAAFEEKLAEQVLDNSVEAISGVLDQSPIDIAAAASLVPLPDDMEEGSLAGGEVKDKRKQDRQAYMRHLFGVAQETGANLRSYLPSKLPDQLSMHKVQMPNVSLPTMSMPNVSLPSMSMPGVGLFAKRSSTDGDQKDEAVAHVETTIQGPNTEVNRNQEPAGGAQKAMEQNIDTADSVSHVTDQIFHEAVLRTSDLSKETDT